MFKLYAINIYILLLHIVANQERFFIKRKDQTQKIEFTLNVTTVGGNNFYNLLKSVKTINSISMKFNNNKYEGTIENLNAPQSQSGPNTGCDKGEIVAEENQITICTGSKIIPKLIDKIGNISTQPEFDEIFDKTNINLEFQFQLEEENNESPKKTKKIVDWKTLKIHKRTKALKRYRIVKRWEKLKRLKNY